MHTLPRHLTRFPALLAIAALIGWAALHLPGSARSARQAQSEATREAVEAARARLDRARANRKGRHAEETTAAVDDALAAYNAAVAARAGVIRERVRELEGLPEKSYAVKEGAEIRGLPGQASGELQALRAELRAISSPALNPQVPALVSEVEPNNTPAQAMQLDPGTAPAIVLGATFPGGDQDYFKFTAPAGAKVWAYVDTGGTRNTNSTSRDSFLTLFSSDGTTVIEEDDDDGTGNGCDGTPETVLASVIAGTTLTTAGTYYLRVEQAAGTGVIDPYTLYVVLTTAAPAAESEPNDTSANANPIVTANSTVGFRSGAIGTAGDVDFYSVEAKSGDIIFIGNDDDPERDGSGTDTAITLISPTGTTLLEIDNSDDEGFPAPPAEGACYAIPTAGTYFVRVSHFLPTGTGTYHLMVAITGQVPSNCPAVTSINPTTGAVGSSVTVTGTNFTGVTAVRFANNVAATFAVNSDTQLTVTVPTGAVTGPITVTKPNCADARSPNFVVPGTGCPTVTGINPTTGVSGTRLAITGTNLSQVTAVRFAGNAAATFTVTSDTLITATVPAGAVTGPVTVSRSDCPDVQTSGFTISTGAQAELAIDDGTFEAQVGLVSGGTDYVVNRLTPTAYPATLSRVAIFFRSGPGTQVGTALTVLVGTNPGGGTNIDNISFQTTAATIQGLDQFNVFAVPAVTINSGDFVVGYSTTYSAGTFPDSVDRTPPSQQRSYLSTNGATFLQLDTLAGGTLTGNFGIRGLLATSIGNAATVSAAGYQGAGIAQNSINAIFGSGLATSTQMASTIPLPTQLAGTTVKVRDSAGAERLAPLFFVANGQINFLNPDGTATGAATVTVTSGTGAVSTGAIQVVAVAPALFSANASGNGVAAAQALRVRGGSQSYEPVAQFDAAQAKFVPLPIDLGPASDQVFLVLYGTGIRNRTALEAVTAKIGGTDAPVSFAGAQGGFVGLDQVNLAISRSLIGRGNVDVVLTVDGKPSNAVQINIK
ncbi:MAG TPA: IPT/TIG domain-containing protein [Blastocatellia bacterium]|nr:IPT/TIG domain-containing protein [Blastocatellia bacterium]